MPRSVLIIEDEATLAKNMKTYLQRQGYEVSTVASGEEGLSHVEASRPDIVLLDYHLPRMNGLEVLGRLQEQAHPVKAIMITGQGNDGLAALARQAGAYDYRSKPMPLSDLARLVENVFADTAGADRPCA